MINPTNKKWLFLIKLVFGLGIIAFVSWKVFKAFKTFEFDQFKLTGNGTLWIVVAVLLMPLNWSLEALKWQSLMRNTKEMSFRESLSGVLAGVSTGIVTPNRIGNFIGRTVHLDADIKVRAILLTFLANVAQFIVTVFFGAIGFLVLGNTYVNWPVYLIWILVLLGLVAGLALYFNPALIKRKPFMGFFSKSVSEGIDFVTDSAVSLKAKVILLSSVRYLVFVGQYLLLLLAFYPSDDFGLVAASIGVVYLIMTLIPSLFFGKLFVREAAGLLVLSTIGIADPVILISGFLLWFINIAVPSITGGIILIRKK